MPRKSLLSVPDCSIGPAQRVKLLSRVAAFYHRTFMERPEGVGYLTKVCGIRDASLFKNFQVGLANGTLLEILPKDEPTLAQLKALGVLTEAGNERFEGCLVFPLWDAEGAVVSLCGRRMSSEDHDAEVALPGDPQGLWNVQACKRSASILLTDSIVDALMAIDRGLPEAMPRSGPGGLTAEQLHLLGHCGVKRVAIAFRGDEAGQRRANAIREQLQAQGIAAATVALCSRTTLNAFLAGPDPELARAALHGRVAEAFAGLAREAGNRGARALSVSGERIERTGHGFKLTLHGRSYEVKGIARETTQLKATIKASGDPAKGFELTTLDLYSSRSREAYTKACVALFGESDTVIKADLARLLERIEAWRPDGDSADSAPRSSPEDEARGLAFLRNPELFEELLADLRTLGVAGEETNKLACYLACVSRKLDDPLSLLIQSRSAAGKSTLQHAVLALTPDEDQVHYTRLTSQALFYQEEMRLAHKVLALEETQGLGEAAYSLRALQSAKRLTVATTTKDPLTGKMRTEHYAVQGPVAVLLTTSSASLDEETASRFLTLTIDESQAMTETILASQRHRDTLAGYLAELDREAVVAKHHAAQRLLEPLVVINPYAEQLTFPAYSLRARRDHKKYLMLVKAVAFLFQKQRAVKEAERGGKAFRYVEITREDIRRANALASRILAHSVDELSAPARTLLRHIQAMVKAYCTSHDVPPSEFIFTRKDIREATGWSDWQVRTHARELEDLEYLRARAGAWGKEYVYALAWDEDEKPFSLALTDPDTLTEAR
jgi:hypothetical protein